MLREEEAIKYIQNLLKSREDKRGKTETDIALEMAIKALEQQSILNKIRTEIEKLQKMCDKDDLNLMAQHSAFGMVLDVFHKYMTEGEGRE